MLRGTCLVLLLAAPSLGAQAGFSVGAGAGSIRYAGGSSLGNFTISPVGLLEAPTWSLGAAAMFGPLHGGRWAGQLRGDGWVTLGGSGGLRPAAALILEGSDQTDGPATGGVHALIEGVLTREGWGAAAGIGPSLGLISDALPVSGLHVRGRAWGRIGTALATATVEPQSLRGALTDVGFTDLTIGIATPEGRVSASGWIAARLTADSSRAAGSVSARVAISSRVAIEASGGSFLADPYQGFPASVFATVGARLYLTGRPTVAPRGDGPRPAVAERDGPEVVVRFTVPHARQVAIAGEWSDWRPVPLTPVGQSAWEARLLLVPGMYRFTLVVDGTRWMVPAGVVTVPDEMGGEQGLLLVP
jgi:hypothetical protein